ncbi:MAG: hypothetical protein WHS83_19260, partial [Chloroflexus sp.]|uniref:hypothetical protein n=1 Tax=Chloroflexus sp. TaxID=1904827 RepID=UPI0030A121A0
GVPGYNALAMTVRAVSSQADPGRQDAIRCCHFRQKTSAANDSRPGRPARCPRLQRSRNDRACCKQSGRPWPPGCDPLLPFPPEDQRRERLTTRQASQVSPVTTLSQ